MNMSVSEWHKSNRERARAEKARYRERFDMSSEDFDADNGVRREEPADPKAGNGLHRNIHPDPDLVAKRNSNWEKQQSDPEWYGPYLDEDPTGARSDAQWKKVDKGTKIVFHRKQDPASHLRVAEVLELDKAERKLTVWYYIHSSSDYDVERPLKLWNCASARSRPTLRAPR